MAGQIDSEDSIFENLRRRDNGKAQEEKTRLVNERERELYEKQQRRLSELNLGYLLSDTGSQIDKNKTLPCTISSVRVLGASNTRPVFLKRILEPLLSANQDRPYTLSEAIRETQLAVDKLHRLDIFHQPISLNIDRPDKTDPSSTPTDIDVYISAREKGRIALKTGTEAGNAEGSAYTNLFLRNIFGGAESLNLNASLGTRTRTAYQANFESPILANPDFRGAIGGLASSTQKPWASHEEVLKGGWAKLRWLGRGGKHELGYTGSWRQVTGLAEKASPTVRGDAGDSIKSSVAYSVTNDQRDYPLLPQSGYFTKSTLELAGWGPLQGDVAFGKAELEGQAAVPISIPGVKGNSGVALTTSLRAGLMYPLPLGFDSKPQASRINDRFQLGGPTDVRGFRLSGLGPRDGSDAVGGDVYAAGSANLLFPLPRLGPEKPFRIQAFVNGGRLLALQRSDDEKEMTARSVQKSVLSTMSELGNGLPTMAAGIGLVYGHPVARFELNFSLPLVIRKGAERLAHYEDPAHVRPRTVAYMPQPLKPGSSSNTQASGNQSPVRQCFGSCNKTFPSYRDMFAHLESRECVTDVTELRARAALCPGSGPFLRPGFQDYLLTQDIYDRIAFDTDGTDVWECPYCRRVFYSIVDARKHEDSLEHRQEVFCCPGCSFVCAGLSTLFKHVEGDDCDESIALGNGAWLRLLRYLEGVLRDRPDPSIAPPWR
ncbi:MAG: hypothetical protein L6R37_005992 [Teloschistes peruensis]|nr:MAG: hypothetical protein L6R37_005992 [Teloschistes peruensis]